MSLNFPSLTLGLFVVLAVAYIAGARYPALAQKVGLA